PPVPVSPRYRHHRDLHSFPTRRSSDLEARAHPETGATPPGSRPGSATRRWAGRVERAVSSACKSRPPTYRPVGRSPSRGSLGDTDRKSTRLNSSHVKISYAVFCLKKKK